jgi:hypothetical protein
LKQLKLKNAQELLDLAKYQAERKIESVENRVNENQIKQRLVLKRQPLTKRLEETRNERALFNYHQTVRSWQRARS